MLMRWPRADSRFPAPPTAATAWLRPVHALRKKLFQS